MEKSLQLLQFWTTFNPVSSSMVLVHGAAVRGVAGKPNEGCFAGAILLGKVAFPIPDGWEIVLGRQKSCNYERRREQDLVKQPAERQLPCRVAPAPSRHVDGIKLEIRDTQQY